MRYCSQLEVRCGMKHRSPWFLPSLILLVLTVCVGVSPRVMCSCLGGHVAMESLLTTCCDGVEASCVAGVVPLHFALPASSEFQIRRITALSDSAADSCRHSLISYTHASRGSFQRIPLPFAASPRLAFVAARRPESLRPAWNPVWRHGGPPTPLDFRTALLI